MTGGRLAIGDGGGGSLKIMAFNQARDMRNMVRGGHHPVCVCVWIVGQFTTGHCININGWGQIKWECVFMNGNWVHYQQ